MLRTVIVTVLPLLLANCASVDRDAGDPRLIEPTQVYAFNSQTVELPPSESVVRLPGAAGRILRVRERRFVNGAAQELALGDGDPDNRLEIAIGTELDTAGTALYVPMAKPTEEGIRFELAERFPGIPMQVVTRPMNNAYGAFGLAIGAKGRDGRCIYGWQWIEDVRGLKASKASVFRKFNAMASGRTADAWLRLRVCRTGLTVDQLATAMTQILIGGPAVDRLLGVFSPTADGLAAQRSLESQVAPVDDRLSRYERGLPSQRPAPVRRSSAPQRKQTGSEGSGGTWRPVEQDGKRYLAPVGSDARHESGTTRLVPRPGGGSEKPATTVGGAAPARTWQPGGASDNVSSRPLDSSVPSRAYNGPSARD